MQGYAIALSNRAGVMYRWYPFHPTWKLGTFQIQGDESWAAASTSCIGGWAMDCEGFPQKAWEQWSYSSKEIINSNPVTGSSQAPFNELDSNKENKNTLKAAVWENG